MSRCLIIEDSRLARKELHHLVKGLDIFSTIKEVESAPQARDLLKEEDFDVLFLDIHMPGENGFELLESLDYLPKVIFTTAYDEYAIKSFEYNAIDYLLKPIKKERLEKAVNKLSIESSEEKNTEDSDKQIFVRDGDQAWFVKMKDIRWFESVGNYARIYFDNNKPLIYKSLNNLESTLDTATFFRINRQNIININFVKKMDKAANGNLKIEMKSGELLEASRRQSSKIKERFSF